MADASDTRALLLTIQANTELLRSNLSAAERAVQEFTDHTKRHLDNSDHRFEALGKSLERLERPLEGLKRIGEGAFAFLVGESLLHKGREMLEFAGNIEFMSQRIGVSTTFLQQFRFAASQSGASIEVSDTALQKFTRSVGEAANGNKKMIELFDRLGVKVLDASGKVRSVEGVFRDTATGISKIEAPAQRSADTLTLMGRTAGAMIPLMSKGAVGFNELAAAAEQLGVVLSPDLIEHSEEVNHKLAALKLILDAQMASAVAQNAQAIESVANALVQAAGAISRFLSADPARALGLLGALSGFKIAGGPGAVVGAVAGVVYGKQLDDANNDLDYRAERLKEAVARVGRDAKAPASNDQQYLGGLVSVHHDGQGSRDDLAAATHDYLQERDRYLRAFRAPHEKHEGPGGGSEGEGASNPPTKHGKTAEQLAREAEARRQKALAEDHAFEGELRSAQQGYAKAEAALADTAQAQLAVELQELRDSLQTRDQQIDDQVTAGRISAARGEQLKTLYAKAELDHEELAKRKEQARLVDEAGARAQLDIQGEAALLQLDDRIATTRKERLEIELKLLHLQEQAAIRAQDDIIAKSQPGSEAAKNAQTTKDQINAQHGRNVQTIKDQNADPLQAYSKQLHAATDDMNDALKSVEVDGLQSLQEGLLGIVSGTESVGSAFKKMADQIIADLARILIQKFIVGLISHFANGGQAGGGGGGGSDGYANGGIPRYDGGGKIAGPGTGRSDSILAILGGNKPIRVSNGEFIVNAQATHDNLDLLEAMNSGRMPRFADGGLTAPRIPRNMNGYGGGGVTIQLATNVQMIGTTSDDVAAMRQEMARRDAALPGQIISTVTDARSRRIIP